MSRLDTLTLRHKVLKDKAEALGREIAELKLKEKRETSPPSTPKGVADGLYRAAEIVREIEALNSSVAIMRDDLLDRLIAEAEKVRLRSGV